MSRLIWNAGRQNLRDGHQAGCPYPMNNTGTYDKGVAWNGLTAVTESPSGAEETSFYADEHQYCFSALCRGVRLHPSKPTPTPTEWEPCDGSAQVATGVSIGQQKRQGFGFELGDHRGNDVDDEVGQKIHIAWNSTELPPAKRATPPSTTTPMPSPSGWECTTSPVSVTGHRPTSHMEIDCAKLKPATVKAIQDKLWGTETAEQSLPSPTSWIKLITDSEGQV